MEITEARSIYKNSERKELWQAITQFLYSYSTLWVMKKMTNQKQTTHKNEDRDTTKPWKQHQQR